MRLERRSDGVEIRAPAKVNLFLEVLAIRPDGYHEIATLMVAVTLFDTLEFQEDVSGDIVLWCDHPGLETGPANLVCRAADLLRQKTGTRSGARIRLAKRIPLAAGLAGGSSDAAATLVGLNELWRLGLGPADLAGLAGQIGSDVGFFLGGPAAWCTGRGEIVTPLALARQLDFLIVCPAVGLATAEVYRNVAVPANPASGEEIRQAVAAGDVDGIGRLLFNRLQPAAQRLCPEVAAWHARLAASSPAGVVMTGSGSSVLALCPNRRSALQLARDVRQAAPGTNAGGFRMFLVRSCV
jgi:4-diphosphocytidyl-2-C-methyl-D-erythritol kinase